MAILPETLETPERDLELLTRAPGTAEDGPDFDEADELRVLRAKIEAARSLQASPRDMHCRDCFQRGRDATLRALEED